MALIIKKETRMPVKIARKSDSDTNDKLIGKFKKAMRDGRYWMFLKKNKYFTKKRSKRLDKARALKREDFRAENKKKELFGV